MGNSDDCVHIYIYIFPGPTNLPNYIYKPYPISNILYFRAGFAIDIMDEASEFNNEVGPIISWISTQLT